MISTAPMMGGSWVDPPALTSPAAMTRFYPGYKEANVGFRVVIAQ